MAGKHRLLISTNGPKLQDSAWSDFGESFTFAAFTNSTTESVIPVMIVPQVTTSETLGASDAIWRILGGQIAFMHATTGGGLAASTISRLGLAAYRSFGTLSTQITAAGGALTSLAVAGGVNTALPSGQTFTVTTAAGATPQVWTTSAAVAVGAVSIPVNSATPSATYAVSTPLVGQVGNAIAFGWLSTSDGASGTPAFRQNKSVSLPAMTATANPALNTTGDLFGPFLPSYPGDVICLYGVTDSSTLSVPTGIISVMGV